METQTITIVVLACLFILFVIAYIIMRKKYAKQTDSMWNTIHKLNEENSRLNIELDAIYSQRDNYLVWHADSVRTCNQQSKRIAELIDLCDKLQPDLVQSDSDYPKKCIDLVNERLAFHLNYIDRRFKSDNSEKTKEKWIHNFTLKRDSHYKDLMDKLHGYSPKVHVIDRKHIEMGDVSRIGIVNGKIDVKYKDDWFKELKDGEPFYYYYTFGNCVMKGSKPMNYKIDSCIKPRRTREEAEKDKQLYNSQKQK